eukprot:Gb_38565 [translate_table: standard]
MARRHSPQQMAMLTALSILLCVLSCTGTLIGVSKDTSLAEHAEVLKEPHTLGLRKLLENNANSSSAHSNHNTSDAVHSLRGNTTNTTSATMPIKIPNEKPSSSSTAVTAITGQSWCVAKNNIPDSTLQVALDYACGLGGADCGPIQPGGICFDPDSVFSHAAYAFNSYYQKNGLVPGTCDFGGTAVITATEPSYGSCVYPSSGGLSSVLNSSVPTGTSMGLGPYGPDASGVEPIFSLQLKLCAFLPLLVALVIMSSEQH